MLQQYNRKGSRKHLISHRKQLFCTWTWLLFIFLFFYLATILSEWLLHSLSQYVSQANPFLYKGHLVFVWFKIMLSHILEVNYTKIQDEFFQSLNWWLTEISSSNQLSEKTSESHIPNSSKERKSILAVKENSLLLLILTQYDQPRTSIISLFCPYIYHLFLIWLTATSHWNTGSYMITDVKQC